LAQVVAARHRPGLFAAFASRVFVAHLHIASVMTAFKLPALPTRRMSWTWKRSSTGSKDAKAGVAPHAIPKGREGAVCPFAGVRASGGSEQSQRDRGAALAAMETDPDILAERLAESNLQEDAVEPAAAADFEPVELNIIGRTHHTCEETRALVQSIGFDALFRFTSRFYELCFVDQHVDKFIAHHDDPHARRFATFIMEKFGDGTPWTQERRTRPQKVMYIEGEKVRVAYDRSSAHVAAWFSPKREPEKVGLHFKLDDARVWMRLHFLAARETGMFEEHPAFMDYYIRFIAHFIRIYSGEAPQFTRESARWSADPANVQKYMKSGNLMRDVVGQSRAVARKQLPAEEREDNSWPYGPRNGS